MRELRLLVLCGLLGSGLVACGSGDDPDAEVVTISTGDDPVDDEVPAENNDDDEMPVDDDVDEPVVREAPVYAERCPTITDGVNDGFFSGGMSRSFRAVLPDEPEGAPVIFAWHWLGGNAITTLNVLQLSALARAENVIVIAPESRGAQFEWRFTDPPENNADLQLFEDLLACASEQFDVDLDRIYSTGHSAGGLWTSYLTIHASEWLAATAVISGGANAATYQTPERQLPVLIIWGGPNDTYSTFSFEETSTYLADSLRNDGHFVTTCDHGGGHVPPVGGMNYIWAWFEDHPYGVDEPYAEALPDVFPEYCQQPEPTE